MVVGAVAQGEAARLADVVHSFQKTFSWFFLSPLLQALRASIQSLI
jgi:hypothetical protein